MGLLAAELTPMLDLLEQHLYINPAARLAAIHFDSLGTQITGDDPRRIDIQGVAGKAQFQAHVQIQMVRPNQHLDLDSRKPNTIG